MTAGDLVQTIAENTESKSASNKLLIHETANLTLNGINYEFLTCPIFSAIHLSDTIVLL